MSTSHKHDHAATPATAAVTATQFLADLKTLAATLSIDDTMSPGELASGKGTSRVPLEMLATAAGVLSDDPAKYPQFDAAGMQAAVDYELAMTPVVAALQVLANRIDKSIFKKRSTAATQALALYAVLKGNARLPTGEQTRTQVKTMRDLVTTRKKSRATSVSQKETGQVAKVLRANKKAQVAQSAADEASSKAAAATAQAAVSAGTIPHTTTSTTPPAPPAPPAASPSNPTTPAPAPAPAH